jgi:hypothetical protein
LHYGRAATRQRGGWAASHSLVGITRSLRVTGTGPAALSAYKLLTTLDLPLRAAEAVGRYLWCRLRGRARQAERSWADLCGLAWFVRHGLPAFWRA